MRWLFLLLSLPLYATTLSDFAGFSACWQKPRCWECVPYDYTGNGVVDLVDLQVFAERWLEVSYPTKVTVSGVESPETINGLVLDYLGDDSGFPVYGLNSSFEDFLPTAYPAAIFYYDSGDAKFYLTYNSATGLENAYTFENTGVGLAFPIQLTPIDGSQSGSGTPTGTATVTEIIENTGVQDMITYSSRKMLIDGNTGDRTMTAPYLVLFDYNTGNVVDKTTGVPGASETYAANAITPDGSAVHGESNLWVFTIPPLADIYEYAFRICDAASPAKTDVSVIGGFLDPKTLMTYTDGLSQGKLRIR